MGAGTYTSPKRIERNGILVAFDGEVMTMAEAERRGLVKTDDKPKADSGPSRKDLVAEAEALGIAVPSKATRDAIATMIADKQAEIAAATAAHNDGPDAPDADAVASPDTSGDDGTGAE